jgi:hypothetical protein
MGRHADPSTPRRKALLPLIATGVVVLLVAGGLVWWLTPLTRATPARPSA